MDMKPMLEIVEKPNPEVFEGPCNNLLVAKVDGEYNVVVHIQGLQKDGKAVFAHQAFTPQRCFGCNRLMDEHTDLVPRVWGEDKKVDEYMRQLGREGAGRRAAKEAEAKKAEAEA